MERSRFICLSAVLLCLVFSFLYFITSTCEDDQKLENGLKILFSKEMGYTLLGEKPVSIDEWSEDYLRSSSDIEKMLQFLQRTFRGSPRFIFKSVLKDDGLYRIELIHKQALKEVIYGNRDLCSIVKKKFKNPEILLHELETSKERIFDLLESNDFLKGVVLGYGRANSKYFCRRCDLGFYLKKYPIVCILPFNPKPSRRHVASLQKRSVCLEDTLYADFEPKVNKNFDSLEDEWRWIQKVFWDLRKESLVSPPCYLSLPVYVCRHGGDSERVRSKYVKARDRLANLLYSRSFKEVIMEEAGKEVRLDNLAIVVSKPKFAKLSR